MALKPPVVGLLRWYGDRTKGGFIPRSVLKEQADYHLKMAEICKKAAELAPTNHQMARGTDGGVRNGRKSFGNRTETTLPKALLALGRSHTTAYNAFTKAAEIPDKVAKTLFKEATKVQGSSSYQAWSEWHGAEENALTKGANAWLLGNHQNGYQGLEDKAIKFIRDNQGE